MSAFALTDEPRTGPADIDECAPSSAPQAANPFAETPPSDPEADVGLDGLTDHHLFLKRYIARRIRSPQDAEDYAQDVYLRVLASAGATNKVQSWRGMLARTASSVIVDRFRRDQSRMRTAHESFDEHATAMADATASPETTTMDRQRLGKISQALALLDPVCRDAFMMARVDGESHRVVAERLGIETVAVGRHIEKALAALARKRLDDDDDI